MIERDLYTRILVWAYEKGNNGFTEEELKERFNLSKNNNELFSWYIRMFGHRTVTDYSRFPESLMAQRSRNALTEHLTHRTEGEYWGLTQKGYEAVINLLLLQDAKNSAEDANKLAQWAIWIGIIVGLAQIVVNIITT